MIIGKIKMLLIVTAILGVLGFGAWKYYQYTQEQIRIYATNAAVAEQAQAESQAALESTMRDLVKVQDKFNEVNSQFSSAQSRVDDLEKKLSEHELGQLAQARPDWVEKIIDKGSADVLRCIEILSGAPLTEDEINAVKKSKTNTQCPDIANPNYIPK